jgi:hypothetical protein
MARFVKLSGRSETANTGGRLDITPFQATVAAATSPDDRVDVTMTTAFGRRDGLGFENWILAIFTAPWGTNG